MPDPEPVILVVPSQDRMAIMALHINGRILREKMGAPLIVLKERPLSDKDISDIEKLIASNPAMIRAVMQHSEGAEVDAGQMVDGARQPASGDRLLEIAKEHALFTRPRLEDFKLTPPMVDRSDRRSKGERRWPDPRRGKW